MKKILNYAFQTIAFIFITILITVFSTADADWIDSNGLQWKPANTSAAPDASYRIASFDEVEVIFTN